MLLTKSISVEILVIEDDIRYTCAVWLSTHYADDLIAFCCSYFYFIHFCTEGGLL